MSDQMIFKRYEVKYMLTRKQYNQVLQAMEPHMKKDVHGRNTICSLYFDTPSWLLIRRSMEHPTYKEKLRLRSYGVAKSNDQVFLELKKKYNSVVYKRRIGLSEEDAMNYLLYKKPVEESQIAREIDYCMDLYEGLKPAVLLTYEREAYYGRNDHEFRVTFDENILWRDYDLCLTKGIYGTPILNEDQVLMEVKTAGAMPLWMAELLGKLEIYKTSFSKYANAYRTIMMEE